DIKTAVRMVLGEDDLTQVVLPEKAKIFEYWGEVLRDGKGMPEHLDGAGDAAERPDMLDLWKPIEVEEIKKASVAGDSAAGIDGISPKQWNRINYKFKKLIYNLFMFYQKVPKAFKVSRTVFIPKKEGGSSEPGDYRPLTVGSVVLRGFNKILAERLVAVYRG